MATQQGITPPRPPQIRSRYEIQPTHTFNEAFPVWLEYHSLRIVEITRKDYQRYAKAVSKVLGDVRLRDITPGLLREYQAQRKQNDPPLWAEPAGPQVINKEIGTLLQVRRMAEIRDSLEKTYEPLPLPLWQPPKTITNEEERRFLRALASRPEWEMVFNYTMLGFYTGLAGSELRGIHLGDIYLDDPAVPVVTVRRDHAKNQGRIRRVPLVPEARAAISRLVEIATAKGSTRVEHYLFPFRVSCNHWEPTRRATQSLIRKTWYQARDLADLPKTFTPHCMRHQTNTKLYESGADDMTVMAIMGHQSRRMSEHYSGIREQHKRETMHRAMSAVRPGPTAPVLAFTREVAQRTPLQPQAGDRQALSAITASVATCGTVSTETLQLYMENEHIGRELFDAAVAIGKRQWEQASQATG